MGCIAKFFDYIILKLPFMKYKRIHSNNIFLDEQIDLLSNLDIKNLPLEEKCKFLNNNRNEIIDLIIEGNKISEKQLQKNVKYDLDFLQSSIKNWDYYDFTALIIFFGIYVSIMQINSSAINDAINDGKQIHSDHSGKPKKDSNPNEYHYKMPNDKIPSRDNYGGSKKLNDEGYAHNHRYVYGHDIFKPWQVFKDLNSIEYVEPILGSYKLGAVIKQIYHLFYDTFSETGIPAPGSTYLPEWFRSCIKNDTFTKFFSLHIEDLWAIGIKHGLEGLSYIYFRIRTAKDTIESSEEEAKNIWKEIGLELLNFNPIKIKDKEFKEYEFNMLLHLLIIIYQIYFCKNFRDKTLIIINAKSIISDMIKYVALQVKWNTNYKNMLLSELQSLISFEIPDSYKEKYKKICNANNIEYSNDAFILLENITNKLILEG